jgi:histidine triad (HIT) family protein
MESCIFCKIINGDIPAIKVYEDQDVLAFLDISQVTKGHTLIIPKDHCQNIFEINEDLITKIFKPVPKLAKAISQAFNANGMNIINNNKEAAGQTVFHYHVHLIPRYDAEDGFKALWMNNMDKYSQDQLNDIANNIINHL